MKITVIGGGPGGLYFSILTKKRLPNCEIEVFEQNKPDDSFGFGVVFSDETLSEFLSYDPRSYDLIRNSFAYWDNLDVARNGEKVRIKGNGFCGCSRLTLLQLLRKRCQEEGIKITYDTRIESLDQFKDSDIIVASDGIGSKIRSQREKEFKTKTVMKTNQFVWLGSTKPLDAFTYFFKDSPYGSFCAHTYQYEKGKSTWIFECTDETHAKGKLGDLDEAGIVAFFEDLYKEELDGHPLITNNTYFRQFPHITNDNWYHDNIVLLGDAKATAHYSIGSGTKLAMECAIALSDSIVEHPNDVTKAFQLYDTKRRIPVEKIQHAALVSLNWFEDMDRHMVHDFDTFSFSVMSRSKKITIENQARRDANYATRIIKAYNKNANNPALLTPPAFSPYQLGNLTLSNKIVMSPMGQYSATHGLANDWHKVHYGSRAVGGVGLIIAEMTAVSKDGRITPGCAGLYTNEHTAAWKNVTDFIHQNSNTKIGIQLGHAGRKGACNTPENGGLALTENAWNIVSASAIPFSKNHATPTEISKESLQEIQEDFVSAAYRAKEAGFDLVEIQAHHGFLLASFLSPLTNQRIDGYGGNIKNRSRFPLSVIAAVRTRLGKDFPLSVRISATDWADGGITEADIIYFAKALKDIGVAIINVSTGNTVSNQKPVTGRMWQSNFAELIKTKADIPTITAGNIQDIDQVNTLLLNKRADLIALGRPFLTNPSLVKEMQAYEQFQAKDFEKAGIPAQYVTGYAALYNMSKKQRIENEAMKIALKPKSHITA